MLSRAWGITRSLVMYHGQPAKYRRMVRFYGQFLGPGDLGFDVGAHVGSRVRAWRRLGARVIALEPQPDCLWILRLLFGRSPSVSILPVAVGAAPGHARLAVSSATPTVSSMSTDWMSSVATDPGFARVRWDKSVDVEGFEVDVLKGLSTPLRALSFEYLPPAHDAALTALGLVERLGDYEYNYVSVETARLASTQWLPAADLLALLERFRPLGRSGDVYARLR